MVTVSPQLAKYTKQVVKKNNLDYPVLIDQGNGLAEKLGLVITLPQSMQEVYLEIGIDLVRFNGEQTWQLPMPSHFIIDRNGTIRHVEVHPDHTTRPEPTDLPALLRNL